MLGQRTFQTLSMFSLQEGFLQEEEEEDQAALGVGAWVMLVSDSLYNPFYVLFLKACGSI